MKKRDQVCFFLLVDEEAFNETALIGVLFAVTAFQEPPAPRIVLDHFFECRDRAVVHVGRGHRDVPKARWLELSFVCRVIGDVEKAFVPLWVASILIEVVEAVVEERLLVELVPVVVDRLRKEKASVTMEALQRIGGARRGGAAEEEGHPPLLGCGQRGFIAFVPPVVPRVEAQQRPLKSRDRLRDAVQADWIQGLGEGFGKHLGIALVVSQPAKELVFHTLQPKLDWIGAEHRH